MDIQALAEELLWDKVSDYIEEIEEFQKIIIGISYIDHKVVGEVERCKILDTEEIHATGYESNGKICIDFEMPFILMAYKSKEQLFRVTAYAKGKAIIENGEQVEIYDVTYDDVEVDSMYL